MRVLQSRLCLMKVVIFFTLQRRKKPATLVQVRSFLAAGPHGKQAERQTLQASRLPRQEAATGGEAAAGAAAAPRHEEHAGEIRQQHDGTPLPPAPRRRRPPDVTP